MNYDVIKAEYVAAFRLKISFADGNSGEVDFLPIIEKGGVFAVLKDLESFKSFRIDADWNTITWCNGELDIAPETLYYDATGSWPNREPIMHVAEEVPSYRSSDSE